MLVKRGRPGAAFLRGMVYVFGGIGKRAQLTAEACNTHTGKWKPLPDLLEQMTVGICSVFNNRLFCVGSKGQVQIYYPTESRYYKIEGLHQNVIDSRHMIFVHETQAIFISSGTQQIKFCDTDETVEETQRNATHFTWVPTGTVRSEGWIYFVEMNRLRLRRFDPKTYELEMVCCIEDSVLK
jgi:hypothetical protein